MITEKNLQRYRHEKENLIVEIAVKNSRQLFNERDPAPFRERDLDPQFVTYVLSMIEEFPIRTKMKMRIISSDSQDINSENILVIKEAIRSYFLYEANLARSKLRKRLRTARFFSMIGIFSLFVSLSLAQLINSIKLFPSITEIVSVGLVIIGWVAMWHPIEALLYDWWPIREQRLYFEKIARLEVEVVNAMTDSQAAI